MKKRTRYYALALGILSLGAVILFAVRRSRVPDNTQLYEAKFVFVAPKKWGKIAHGVAAADREFGTLTKCILYTQDEGSSQADVLRYALLSGVDGIITGGMEENPDTEAVILEAQEAGVPVVYVDSDLEGSARNCYIGSDNYEVGRMAGEFLAQETGGQANVCVIVSYENHANQQERLQGLRDAVQDYPGIVLSLLIEGRSSALFLETELPKALQADPEIDSIVCAEGASSHYCWKILQENGIKTEDYCIVGMDYYSDLVPQLEQGVYAGLIWQDQYDMGYQAVRYLKDIADQKERPETVLHTGLALVTTENAADYAIEREAVSWYVF